MKILLLVILMKMAYTENEGSLRMPQQLINADIVDKRGAQLPLELFVTDHNNNKIKLSEYFSSTNDLPYILTLGYYGCPMLCSLVLNATVDAAKNISLRPGLDYKILSISIDEREEATLAFKKRENYTRLLNATQDDFWAFHVAQREVIKQIADAVGFNFYFDEKNNQFAHGAGIFILTPTGILSRTLYGISLSSVDLKFALQEASSGKIGTIVDRIILSCFHYDPDSHRYGIYVLGVMRIFCALTILIMAIYFLVSFRAESRWKT